MQTDEEVTYKLPASNDDEGDLYEISVSLGSASSFTNFKSNTFEFKPTIKNSGKYPISIVL